eukprot:scaffold76019_cov66-Phaeocystis_antarctica.AAC.13
MEVSWWSESPPSRSEIRRCVVSTGDERGRVTSSTRRRARSSAPSGAECAAAAAARIVATLRSSWRAAVEAKRRAGLHVREQHPCQLGVRSQGLANVAPRRGLGLEIAAAQLPPNRVLRHPRPVLEAERARHRHLYSRARGSERIIHQRSQLRQGGADGAHNVDHLCIHRAERGQLAARVRPRVVGLKLLKLEHAFAGQPSLGVLNLQSCATSLGTLGSRRCAQG